MSRQDSSSYCPRCDDDTVDEGVCSCGYENPIINDSLESLVDMPVPTLRQPESQVFTFGIMNPPGEEPRDAQLLSFARQIVNATKDGRCFTVGYRESADGVNLWACVEPSGVPS